MTSGVVVMKDGTCILEYLTLWLLPTVALPLFCDSGSIQEVEHSSFTSLVFSATGGMGHEANIFLQVTSRFSIQQVERSIYFCTWIDKIQAFILLTTLNNPM